MAGVWTRNYYNLLTAYFLCDDTLTSTSTPTDYDPPIRIRRYDGTYKDVQPSKLITGTSLSNVCAYILPPFIKGGSNAVVSLGNSGANTSSTRIGLGAGTTVPTYDDYRTESSIMSGLSLVNSSGTLTQASSYDPVTHHMTSTRSFNVNNTSVSAITISELTIWTPYESGSTDSCMIYRDVFAPIDLQPGETLIISFTRDAEVFNYTSY